MKICRLLFITCTIFVLSACNLHYKDTENAIETPTNIETLFKFQLGYNKDSIKHKLGTPNVETKDFLVYSSPRVFVGLDKNDASYLISNDSRFKTDEGIIIGSSKEEVIETYRNKDLYQYTDSNDDWIYYFANGDVKVVFKLMENKVEQIATGTAPLSQILNADDENDKKGSLDDNSILKDSTYLTFFEDVNLNNKKLLHEDFLQYASNGLIKNIPVPLGMEISEVERKYGRANYVWEDEESGTTELWYKAFNCSFILRHGETAVKAVKCPVDITLDELQNVISEDFEVIDQKEILYKINERELVFNVNVDNRIDYLVLK